MASIKIFKQPNTFHWSDQKKIFFPLPYQTRHIFSQNRFFKEPRALDLENLTTPRTQRSGRTQSSSAAAADPGGKKRKARAVYTRRHIGVLYTVTRPIGPREHIPRPTYYLLALRSPPRETRGHIRPVVCSRHEGNREGNSSSRR